MELQRHGVEFLRPDADVFAPALDGRALTLYDDPAAQRGGHPAVQREGRRRVSRVSTRSQPRDRRPGVAVRVAAAEHRPARRPRPLEPARHGPEVPRARTPRRLSAAALGTDAGCRPDARVVRDRSALGRAGGARRLGHDARTAFGGKRARAAAARGASPARRRRAARARRTRRADAGDGGRGACRRGRDPDRDRRRAHPHGRRTRHRRRRRREPRLPRAWSSPRSIRRRRFSG